MKHVLVIRLSALGDVAIMAPLVHDYAAANPDVTFTVAAPPMLQPLFDGEPNVRFLGVSKKQSATAIYRQLGAVGADTVADLHQVNKVGWALMMMRLRHLLDFRFRIYHLHKGRLSRWLMIHHLSHRPRRPQYDRYEDVFRRMGLRVESGEWRVERGERRAENGVWRVESGEWREESGERRAESGKQSVFGKKLSTLNPQLSTRIGVAPFAQHENKIWPLENTERLVSMFAAKGCEVLLFGSKDEAQTLETWARRYEGVSSLAGRLPFADELKAIEGLTLMVSMDSANMHFASAVGTPVVSIWGATHPDFGFYGYRQDRANALCANLPCQPCSAYGQKPCRYGDCRCLRAVTPEMAMEKIETFIASVQ